MDGTPTERLRTYLAALPPRAQVLLAREFERAVAGGENDAVANLVLRELRRVMRAEEGEPEPRAHDPMRLVFQPFEPFLTDAAIPGPGALSRTVLSQIWQWLRRDGAPAAMERLNTALAATNEPARSADRVFAISDFQRAAAVALANAAAASSAEQRTLLSRIGPNTQPGDLALMADLLRARDAIATLLMRLPKDIREFGPAQVAAFEDALNMPALRAPSLVPFALALAIGRLPMSWQIIRLPIRAAGSDKEQRVAETPYAIAVTMAIQELEGTAKLLRDDLRRMQFDTVNGHLKILHDGVRGVLAELDIRPDSLWGRQLAALRADISNALRSPIEGLPSHVRRVLRQRSANDITQATRLKPTEVNEIVALISILETCRAYANELAINQVSARIHAELVQYVGPTTDALIAALRGCDGRTIAFRRQQADAAIAFSRVLFGDEHALRMQKSADKAMAEEAPARSA